MAIQSFQLDPDATSYTDDEIVGKVNAAADNITRAGSVEATARPIEEGEVGSTEIEDAGVTATDLAASAARDNLRAMANTDRGFVDTNPVVGEFPVIAVQRDAAGKLDVEYDDEAVV